MNNFDIRSSIAKEMREKFRNRNKELAKIENSSNNSEELKNQRQQEIMDIFYDEMNEIKQRPGYIESKEAHNQVIRSNNALQGVLKARSREEKDYEDAIEKLDRDIVQKKSEYETMEQGGEANYEASELTNLDDQLQNARLLKEKSIDDPIMRNRANELEESIMEDIEDTKKTVKDKFIQELAEKKGELDDLVEKRGEVQRTYRSNMREIDQDIKENVIENLKVNELYFGKEKTISRNKLIKNIVPAEKNNELNEDLSFSSVFDILDKYGVLYKDLGDNVILPPDDKETIIVSDGVQNEVRYKKLSVNKFVLFMDAIDSRGVKLGDIVVYSGKIDDDMVRENTYYAIYLTELDKTIFLNIGYGEATFVCKGKISVGQMVTYGKERLQTELGAKRIIFNETDIDGWRNSLNSAIFQDEGQVNQISVQDMIRRELVDENGELTEKGVERFESNTESRKYLKSLNDTIGYQVIARKFGVNREHDYDLYKDEAFCELSAKIFGENHPKVLELKDKLDFNNLSLESLQSMIRRELIGENGELTEKGKEWFGLSAEGRRIFKLEKLGLGYLAIVRKFGIEKKLKNDLYKYDVFYELSVKIFGEKYPNVLELKKRRDLNYLSLEEIQCAIKRELIDEYGKLTEKGEKRFNSNTKTRKIFKFTSVALGYQAVAGKFGVFRKKDFDLLKDDAFCELSEKIFGENHPKVLEFKEKLYFNGMSLEDIQNMIRSEFVDEGGILTDKGEERFQLNTDTRRSYKLTNGLLGYIGIARKFGIQTQYVHDLFKDEMFYKLSEKIFGENHPKVLELKEKISMNSMSFDEIQDMIKSELIDDKGELTEAGIERFALNVESRKTFKLENSGLGYLAIARKFGVERDVKFDLYKDVAFYELSVKIFGEDNSHVKILRKQLSLKKIILTGGEIRKIFLENKDEIEQFFSSDMMYRKWISGLQGENVKKYRGFPKSFNGLISALGGDKMCQEGMYVMALLESESAGKRYFQGWKNRGEK